MRIVLTMIFLSCGLSFWAQRNCNGRDTVEVELSPDKKLKYEYFYCNDTCYMTNVYKAGGRKIGTILCVVYAPDTIVINMYYRKNGAIIIKERQVNGKDDGEYFIYYSNGSVKLDAQNSRGKRVSEKKYDAKGRMEYESKLTEGDTIVTKFYDKNGAVKKEKKTKYDGISYKWEF